MATPAEVLEHFAETREGSSIARARAAAKAFRSLMSLSAPDKRHLAVTVAQKAAPHLVPRIQSETGLDLTREQVQAVIDMVGRLDADDLEDLRHTVLEGGGLEDLVTTTEPAPDAQESEPTPEVAAVAVPDEPEGDDPGVERELVELDPEPEPEYEAPPAPAPREFVSIFDSLPDTPDVTHPGRRTPPLRDERWPRNHRSEPTPPSKAPRPAADEADITARVRAARQPLVEQLRRQATNAGRLRVLRANQPALKAMDAVERSAVVNSIPDGWARRRALALLLDAQALSAAELPTLLSRLGSPMNRTWVCASAIEAGMLTVEQATTLVDPRAADRLRARYG